MVIGSVDTAVSAALIQHHVRKRQRSGQLAATTIEMEARMRLIDVEIGRHDWSVFTCGCTKTAAHLADDLLLLASA